MHLGRHFACSICRHEPRTSPCFCGCRRVRARVRIYVCSCVLNCMQIYICISIYMCVCACLHACGSDVGTYSLVQGHGILRLLLCASSCFGIPRSRPFLARGGWAIRWFAGVAPGYRAPVLWCRRRGDAEAAAPHRPAVAPAWCVAVLKLQGCPCIMTSGRAGAAC